MAIEPRIVETLSRPLAVLKIRAPFNGLGPALMASMDTVWGFIRANGIGSTGCNVAQYDAGGLTEAGVEVFELMPPNDQVAVSSTPAGRAATAVHWGSYDGIAATARELREWCESQGYRLAGPSWEIYGHWQEDPAKLRTDIFMLLA